MVESCTGEKRGGSIPKSVNRSPGSFHSSGNEGNLGRGYEIRKAVVRPGLPTVGAGVLFRYNHLFI